MSLIVALWMSSIALAQDTVWAVEDAPSKRFTDAELSGPPIFTNDRLVVLYRENGLIRVRKGNDYGWIAETAVTDVEPEGLNLPTVEPTFPAGQFDEDALKALLERTKDNGGIEYPGLGGN